MYSSYTVIKAKFKMITSEVQGEEEEEMEEEEKEEDDKNTSNNE